MLEVRDARDAGAALRELQETLELGESGEPFLTATITSPPYGQLIDYGTPNQIGHGQSDAAYLADLQRLFATIFDRTRDEGSLWLVVDSFTEKPTSRTSPSRHRMLPFEMISLAEGVGWTLKDVVIWQKDRTRPWSHRGRLRNSFEYVLYFVKTNRFKFRIERLRESADLARWWVRYPERYHFDGKSPDNVWQVPIPTQGAWAGKAYRHACPLPPELVRRMVLLSTDEGDVVYDPFAGVGTVVATANATGRVGIGGELNPTFVGYYENFVDDEVRKLAAAATRSTGDGPSAEVIATLRALKYPKALFGSLRRLDLPHLPVLALGSIGDAVSGSEVKADWRLFTREASSKDRQHLQEAANAVASRAPLSKFGVRGEISVLDDEALSRASESTEWFVYEHGETWRTSRTVTTDRLASLEISTRRGRYLPIVADKSVSIDLSIVGDQAADDPFRNRRSGGLDAR
jgi:DNA modification methylase